MCGISYGNIPGIFILYAGVPMGIMYVFHTKSRIGEYECPGITGVHLISPDVGIWFRDERWESNFLCQVRDWLKKMLWKSLFFIAYGVHRWTGTGYNKKSTWCIAYSPLIIGMNASLSTVHCSLYNQMNTEKKVNLVEDLRCCERCGCCPDKRQRSPYWWTQLNVDFAVSRKVAYRIIL